MKRFFGLLVVLALFCGCDDGDMQVESFDFSNVSASKCGTGQNDFFIYKVSGNEALLIQIDENVFPKIVSPDGTPKSIAINGTSVKVIYRLYSGTITGNDLCTTIPPSFPTVAEEWNAVGGTIEILTTVVRDIDEDTGSNLITKFSHAITFRNIRFDVGDGKTQTNEVLSFGNYLVDATATADFTNTEVKGCDGQPLLFKYIGTQAITLLFDPADFATLFANQVTGAGAPRTQVLNAANTASFRIFSSALSQNSFCVGPLPAVNENQLWIAAAGGTIEVTTTTLGDDFEHTITLKNVNFENPGDAGQSFTFGTDYLFGTFVTSN